MSAVASPTHPQDGDKVVCKYIARYAEPSLSSGIALDGSFAHAVVIPAYGEGTSLDRALESVPTLRDAAVLAVVVINEREDSPRAVGIANADTVARLRRRFAHRRALHSGIDVHQAPFGALAVLCVQLPRGQGVGLARKHGVDFALGAWSAGRLASHWIQCTDADVQLPADYFAPPSIPGAAALHRFRHVAAEPGTRAFAAVYDLWLRLHVLGLHWAGSPYAFHTIGSTIAVDACSYAAARGVPRRSAAEDFYLLNKLAKLGRVVSAPSAPVVIDARASDRVPFGTGRAMGRMQRDGARAAPRFYHPDVYAHLAVLLRHLERAVDSGAFEWTAIARSLRARELATAPMSAALSTLGIAPAVERLLRGSADRERRRRAVHGWFDAFRTMKFMHAVRDAGVASVDAAAALDAGAHLLRQSADSVSDDVNEIRRVLDDAELYTCISKMSPSAT